MEITLESVDKVIERTGVSYAEAKAALEITNGNVLDAIILIEEEKGATAKMPHEENNNGQSYVNHETVEELKGWLKELINKGNVTRIKVSKDGRPVVDVPVNAGIAAGVIAIIIPPILAFALVAAVVTKVTIEITMADGSVQVVNKYISMAVNEAKYKASDIADKMKDKVSDVNLDGIKKYGQSTHVKTDDENVFTYTVNFDEVD